MLLWWALGRFAGETRWRWYLTDAIRLPLAAAEELTAQGREPLQATIDGWRNSLTRPDPIPMPAADRARLLRRLAALAPAADAGRFPAGILGDDDPFSPVARAALFTEFGEHACVPLLLHLRSLRRRCLPVEAVADPARRAPRRPNRRPNRQPNRQPCRQPSRQPSGGRDRRPAPGAHRRASRAAARTSADAVHVGPTDVRVGSERTPSPRRRVGRNGVRTPARPRRHHRHDRRVGDGAVHRVLGVLGDVAVHCGTTMDGATIGELRCTQVTARSSPHSAPTTPPPTPTPTPTPAPGRRTGTWSSRSWPASRPR